LKKPWGLIGTSSYSIEHQTYKCRAAAWPNYNGRRNAPMIQPPKDDLRLWLSEKDAALKQERSRRLKAEHDRGVAVRKLGELVRQGKIDIPIERLGELALQVAFEQEVEREVERVERALDQA
jgi:hypothetical protein